MITNFSEKYKDCEDLDFKSSGYWDRDETEKLIQLWKSTPELLKFKSDRKLYQTKLNDITLHMQDVRPGTTLKDMRERMRGLRTQYNREKKRVFQEGLEVKLWCFEDLKFLDEIFSVDQQTQVNGLDDIKNEDEGVELSVASFHYDVDPSHLLENTNPTKRLRKNEDTFNEDNDVTTASIESEWEDILETENGNLSQSLIVKLEQTIDRSNAVLSRLTNVNDSNHRAFVENLLQDMNKMPEHTLRTIKWKITDIVYEAYQDQEKRSRSSLNS